MARAYGRSYRQFVQLRERRCPAGKTDPGIPFECNGYVPAVAPEQNTDQERDSDCVQGRFLSPTSQAVKRRTWLPVCFDGVSYRLSGFLDRLSSRLNGLLGLVELVWTID